MSPVLKITFALGAVCASAIVYYLVRPEPVAAEAHTETYDYKPQMGVAVRPTDAKALAGRYYRGDGTGYNIYLTLNPQGTYMAEWHGCLGTYGEAAGDWKLTDTQIAFTPSKETVFELKANRWARYRKVTLGSVVLIINTTVLSGIWFMCLAALFIAPALMRSK